MFETSSDSSDGGRRNKDDELDDQPTDLLGDDGGTSNTTVEGYTGTQLIVSSGFNPFYVEQEVGFPYGFTPRNAQGYENGRSGYTGPVYGGRQTLLVDTIAGLPTVTSHAPAGIGWVPQSAWDASVWDGVPYDVTGKTTAQICSWVFPTSNTMRGLRQLYEASPPFANPRYPKVFEIDNWNIKVINHFRALFGIGQIVPSYRLYVEAQWATERRWSPKWNSYPSNGTLTYGPCPNANPHCGASFVPGLADQNFYMLPPLTATFSRESVAEALGGTNTNIPWAIKLGRVIASFLCNEGLVGHTGPFLRRQKIGISIHNIGDGTTQFRFKFGGTYTPFAGT